MNLWQNIEQRFSDRQRQLGLDLGLLGLRVCIGAMMAFGHGWGKLSGFADKAAHPSSTYATTG